MRRDHVASTLIRRHFNVVCSLGWHVDPTKTHIRLHIYAFWLESSWRNVASLAIPNAPSKDFDQTPKVFFYAAAELFLDTVSIEAPVCYVWGDIFEIWGFITLYDILWHHIKTLTLFCIPVPYQYAFLFSFVFLLIWGTCENLQITILPYEKSQWNQDCHYENTFIQVYRKTENFQIKKKLWYFPNFCSKHRLWVLVRTASARRF